VGAGVGSGGGSGSGTGREWERDRVGGGGGCSSKNICVSGFGQTHGRGGPAESHREYYKGGGFSGDPTRHGRVGFPRDGAAAGELIGAYGSRLIRLMVCVRPEGFCVFFVGLVFEARRRASGRRDQVFESRYGSRTPAVPPTRKKILRESLTRRDGGGCLFGSVQIRAPHGVTRS
jgi:hypothetical protein